MAKIVFGVATSHSPQLSTPVEQWNLHVDRDHVNQKLHYRGGVYRYDELYELRRGENLGREVSEERWQEKYRQWERRMEEVRTQLMAAAPDILVVIGDDQRELFLDDGMPTFSVFWGDHVQCIPAKLPHESLEPARWANYGEQVEFYPTDSRLGRHIVEQMMVDGFDVTQLTKQAEGRGIGHSFIFTKHRLMKDDLNVPMVPITINTYFPPNQPTCARCYRFGQALRRALESYPPDARVAIVASGGLSHFVVDEDLDRKALEAMLHKDVAALTSLPESHMTSGTSEIKNWITAAGALEHLQMDVVDYIPAYRTPAGTGCGMGFAVWK
ncbi:hypothetical protein [Alicyclobacillus shizuokensis]|uniref:DODA-type extradiol aromatic ring-opening family dioxygenase n=1 Tax=Alicyclobacillus shizuokensis TaxID=392014 RepID=UPI00082F106F|nr:hypothetical protein [Alicyclobacillus shizuokensis]